VVTVGTSLTFAGAQAAASNGISCITV
jgi:hypothetical protein